MTAWTDPDDATLKRMHDDGASFHEIYMALGGRYSRNACIGRAHRLFLRRYTMTPVQGVGQPRLSKRQRQKELPRQRGMDGAKASGLIVRLKRADQERANIAKSSMQSDVIDHHFAVSLFKVKESQCRWPVNNIDPAGRDGVPISEFRFCGAQKRNGSSSCEGHWRRSLQCYRVECAEAAE